MVVAVETAAHACGATPRPSVPACTTLTLHAPGKQFPVDLATGTIGVSRWRMQDGAMSPIDDGFPVPTLQLFRATGSGFEAAAFSLETGAGLVPNARTLRLVDPQPGSYYLAWDGDTCIAQASPAGGGKEVGRFTLTASVPVPGTMGALAATAPVTRGRDFQEGVGGDCRPIMVHVDEAEAVLTLTPSAEILPWADAITTGLEVDGKMAMGLSKPDPIALAEGRLSYRVARICATDTPRYLERPGVAEGRHVGKMIAKIEGRANFASAEVPFEIRCDAPAAAGGGAGGAGGASAGSSSGAGGGDASSDGGGCSVSATSHSSDTPTSTLASTVATAAVATFFARRRRRRTA